MIYDKLAFHNVWELEENPLSSGLRMQRYPRDVRAAMGTRGSFVSTQSSGCEIRFVTDAEAVRISLSALDADGDLMVFRGSFFHSHHRLKRGVMQTILLETPPYFAEDSDDKLLLEEASAPFSPHVWRIMTGRYTAVFHGLDVFGRTVRPPRQDELPGLRWLAYGSSITHGGAAVNYSNCYVQQTARILGADVLNLGLSGACLCEKEAADFLADRRDWDLMTLELGVNMREAFTAEQFKQRVEYLVSSIVSKHSDKTIAVITIYPNRATYASEDNQTSRNEKEFNEILRTLVSDMQHPYLHLIEGREIMRDLSSLAFDLLHPSDYGHFLMGQHLAAKLREILGAA